MRNVLKAYWVTVLERRWLALATFLALMLVLALSVQPPYYVRQLVNLVAAGTPDAQQAYRLLVRLALISTACMLAWFLFDICLVFYEAGAMRSIDQASFRCLMRQALQFFEDRFTGSLVKKSNRFRDAFETVSDQLFFILGRDALLTLFILIIFFREAPDLGLLFLGWLCVFIPVTVHLTRVHYGYGRASAEADSAISGTLADRLTNIVTIKTFAREVNEVERFDALVSTAYRKRVKAWSIGITFSLLRSFLIRTCELGTFAWLVHGALQGRMSAGDFLFFQGYVVWLTGNLREFGNALNRLTRSLADAAEMAEILAHEPSVQDAPTARPIVAGPGSIQLRNVRFSYAATAEERRANGAIRDISLMIEPGQRLALVGHSGSGKSTLARLLLRCMDLQAGQILVDGQDILSVSQESLRRRMAFVPQDPQLFHNSLAENICYGKPDATEEEILKAAERAGLKDFLEKLPKGLDTIVGERGMKLSGGERQRIAIARALLADPRIIILDEATSALDSVTERLIQQALEELFRGRTSITIAHRLSTIRHADLIVVLHHGQIAEQGTHDQLLQQDGIYCELWKHQTQGFITE